MRNSTVTVTAVEPTREQLIAHIDRLDDELEEQKLLNKMPRPRLTACDDLSFRYNGTVEVTLEPEDGEGPVGAVCESSDDGGPAWTVFQNRFDGSVDFFRDFKEYEAGFGNRSGGEFWLGLKSLERLTHNMTFDLKIDMTDATGTFYNRTYLNFTIGPAPYYRLSVSGYDDKNRGLSQNDGQAFATYDNNP